MKLLSSFLFLAFIGMTMAEKLHDAEKDRELELALAKQPKLVVVEVGQTQQSVKVTQAFGDFGELSKLLQTSEAGTEAKGKGRGHHERVEKPQREQEYHRGEERREDRRKSEKPEEFKFKLDEQSKQRLIYEKPEGFFVKKMIEWYENNPETKFQRQCFDSKLKEGDSIDFVIDLATNPNSDKLDKLLAESPLSLYVAGEKFRDATHLYFDAVEIFIEGVTLDMRPKATHTILFNNGRKFYLPGRSAEEKWDKSKDFKDEERNLQTLWPSNTKTVSVSVMKDVVKNHLGHMTKLALWNRANGLPVVLHESRRSKPVYTIVITDGASGASLHDLTDDLSRTTVIDLGNRRFLKNLSASELRALGGGYFVMSSPVQLSTFMDTCRTKACHFASHRSKEN